LLAKSAEERYQTAAGLERDLRRCFAAWEARRRIDAFPLGRQDTPDRLLIPEKLYGREREIGSLLAAFNRVVTSGRPELVSGLIRPLLGQSEAAFSGPKCRRSVKTSDAWCDLRVKQPKVELRLPLGAAKRNRHAAVALANRGLTLSIARLSDGRREGDCGRRQSKP
jgi:hypothetical protein